MTNMGQQFYARYTVEFEGWQNLDDIAKQFDLSYKHTFDEKTGMLLHAWDESKQMDWADKNTGKISFLCICINGMVLYGIG